MRLGHSKEGKNPNSRRQLTLKAFRVLSYPVPPKLNRSGKASGKEIALTFDDGPDPQFTPQILRILDKYQIRVDADTIIAPQSISLMVRHFSDQKVVAVSGNVKVGNVHNWLTRWQQVEYITGFNLERRAYDELNCITVVPGAVGAWRKQAVAKAG